MIKKNDMWSPGKDMIFQNMTGPSGRNIEKNDRGQGVPFKNFPEVTSTACHLYSCLGIKNSFKCSE